MCYGNCPLRFKVRVPVGFIYLYTLLNFIRLAIDVPIIDTYLPNIATYRPITDIPVLVWLCKCKVIYAYAYVIDGSTSYLSILFCSILYESNSFLSILCILSVLSILAILSILSILSNVPNLSNLSSIQCT